MRITSKGQVTIPQAIREQAGLLPRTEVAFEIVKGQVVLKPLAPEARQPGWAMEALQRARGTADEPMFRGWTTDRIMEFLRGQD